MMTELKSELRKLTTIRSTYLITGFAVAILILLAFVFRNSHDPNNTRVLADAVYNVNNTVALFAAVVGILLMAHEYRYNTITYTLTSSNSRTKVLLAKIVAALTFAFVFTLLINVVSLVGLVLFSSLWGVSLAPQQINLLEYFVKGFFYIGSYTLVGLLFASLIRNLVAAIVALFLIPAVLEIPANLLLKHNSVYMPFSVLDQVIMNPAARAEQAAASGPFVVGTLSPAKAALIFVVYLAIAWIVAWYLFLRRDAA